MRREREEREHERENRREREQERENMVRPVDVDRLTRITRITVIGHIRTSGNVVRRGVHLRSTRYTEGPDRSSIPLGIERNVCTECIARRRHGKCSTEGSFR
jgi:hypothetical protein